MKSLFYYTLILGLFISSCSPKFQEYNGNGFGGGMSKSSLSKTNSTSVAKQNVNTECNQHSTVEKGISSHEELTEFANSGSLERLPKIIKIKSQKHSKSQKFNINENDQKCTPKNLSKATFKDKIKSIFSPKKSMISNSKNKKLIFPNTESSGLRWFLFVLGLIIATLSISLIAAGAGDSMFGGAMILVGILWFNYSLILLFGSSVIDNLDDYSDAYRSAVIWSLWSPFLLFIPDIISVPVWIIEAIKAS